MLLAFGRCLRGLVCVPGDKLALEDQQVVTFTCTKATGHGSSFLPKMPSPPSWLPPSRCTQTLFFSKLLTHLSLSQPLPSQNVYRWLSGGLHLIPASRRALLRTCTRRDAQQSLAHLHESLSFFNFEPTIQRAINLCFSTKIPNKKALLEKTDSDSALSCTRSRG